MAKRLTNTEQRIYDALVANPKGLSYRKILAIKPPKPIRKIDICRTQIKVLRQKTGVEFENIRGWGYRVAQ